MKMATTEFNDMLVDNADFLKPFAVNLTKDSEAANDLYQETLYKALANHEKYNAGTNIKAWLFTIMRNIFINNYRRKAKQQTVFDKSANDFLLNNNQVTIANAAEGTIELKEIEKENPNLYKKFVTDINKLDSSYNALKKELPENPNREQLLEAMIENLRLQTEILNQQLSIINQIKASKSTNHDSNFKKI